MIWRWVPHLFLLHAHMELGCDNLFYLSLATLFHKYLTFICQGPCVQSMTCGIFITEFLTELCKHLGSWSPHSCMETVIQTELMKLGLRNKEKDETIPFAFWEIGMGIHHVKH